MKQKDKELLLKDLCARFPYGIKVSIQDNTGKYSTITERILDTYIFQFINNNNILIKPYLRPMCSMTKEEEKEFLCISNQSPGYLELIIQINSRYDIILPIESFDWLNAHHFDYRGLISKGLALEAPEEMYSLK